MSNIWFPLPVALFLRRVVNVLSTLSITHHYLLPPRQSTDKNDSDLPPSPSPSQCAGRIQWGNGRQEDERTWSTIVDNGLDGILQGACKVLVNKFLPNPHQLSSIGEAVYPLVSLAGASLALPSPRIQVCRLRTSGCRSDENGGEERL